MKKLLSLFVAIIATCALWASSVITYEATSKLPETTSSTSTGLHTNAFNVGIATHTFSNGTGTITFSGDVASIGEYAFYKCSGLTSVTIPNSVTSIGTRAFAGCSGLTSVTIPNSMTSIGSYAFLGCSSLTSVTIPNSVTSIEDGAFEYCSGLTSVHISDIAAWYGISFGESSSNPLYYAKHLYVNGSEVTDLIIPTSVTSIGNYAFSGCSGLTSVTIPNSVTSIGSAAFLGCSGLTSVHISDIAAWCRISFGGSGGSSSNPLYYAKHLYVNGSEVTDLIIPTSVTSIGNYAFSGCSGLTSVTIPNSVTSIGSLAFSGCSGLTSVHISDIAAWCRISFGLSTTNPLFYAKHLYVNGSEVTDLIIPTSVTSVGDHAFYNCSGLTSVTIPNSVASIGNYAFSGCSGLTSISIPNSVTSIGDGAFYKCSGLTSVNIPNSVTSIEKYAFYDCSGLTSITIPNSVTSIGTYAFYKCSGLTSITIPSSVTSIGSSAFYNCSGLTSITIPSSVTSIGSSAFYNCTNLKTVYNGSNLNIVKGATTHGYVAYYADNVYNVFVKCKISVLSSNISFGTAIATMDSVIIPSDSVLMPASTVTLTATPNYGYHFVKWSDGVTDNPRILTIAQDTTLIAEFDRNSYSVATTPSDPAMGTTYGDTTALYQDSVTLFATPNYGYHFTQWSDGVTDNPRSFVLTQDTTFVAEFARNSYSIITTSANTTMGMTYGDTTVLYQDSATIWAIPNYGYHFSRWNDGNSDNLRIVMVTEDVTYTAYFEPNTYALSLSSVNGSVSGKKVGSYLETMSITAMPDYGYHFTQWSDGNSDNPRSFVLTQDTTFIAEFERNSYSVTVASSDLAKGIVAGDTTVLYGDTITISATAATGFQFNGWSDGNTDNPRIITLTQDTNLVANFGTKMCTLTIISNIDEAADITGAGTYAYGTAVTCFADVMTDYRFVKWGNGKTANPYKFKIYDDMTLYAFFEEEDAPLAPDSVVVSPGNNDANLQWPQVDNAQTYTMTITKGGEIICSLTFNGLGQLININFSAPNRSAASAALGFNFTVTGLQPGTTYGYAIEAKDEKGAVLSTESGVFTTRGTTTGQSLPTSLDDVATKFLRNGQILIQRGCNTYDLRGQVVK